MRILNCHPEIRCMREPFNPDQSGRTYLDRVTDMATLDDTLAEIWSIYDGIKHVWHPSGWPFGSTPFYNLRLLTQPRVRVLFLGRRNQIRRLISFEIAVQTNVWHRPAASWNAPSVAQMLAPLDSNVLRRQLRAARDEITRCRRHLNDQAVEFLELSYEDFFDPELSMNARLTRAQRLFQFLNRPQLTEGPALATIQQLLDPTINKVTSESTYRRIPNIEEIDALCGSDRTGWVFGRKRPTLY
jgi:hypothetical protein